mgnify:CR=1 FL=1
MKDIKKGDIVGRISYGKDILFIVDRIVNEKNTLDFNCKDNRIVILKGLIIRIKADSPISDLELIDKEEVKYNLNTLEGRISTRIRTYNKRIKRVYKYGKVLHLDGDCRYTQKSLRYYRDIGLDAIVRNVSEKKQPMVVKNLLEKYKPDILIVTRSW